MAGPWQLYHLADGNDWQLVGIFESLSAAAGRMGEIESYPVEGVFLEAHVIPGVTDEEVTASFEHKGRRGCYVIKRVTH